MNDFETIINNMNNDTNNDNTYEFILSCGKFGSNNQVDMLYEFEENAFKIAISNQ